jgi:hypothetical protein
MAYNEWANLLYKVSCIIEEVKDKDVKVHTDNLTATVSKQNKTVNIRVDQKCLN